MATAFFQTTTQRAITLTIIPQVTLDVGGTREALVVTFNTIAVTFAARTDDTNDPIRQRPV